MSSDSSSRDPEIQTQASTRRRPSMHSTPAGAAANAFPKASDESLALPTTSALICTRNRGASLVPTVCSILSPGRSFQELVIIDQSPGDATEAALAPFRSDPRLHYIRSTTQGLSIARNLALAEARCEVCAFTDDDCEVDDNWPRAHQEIFARHPQVAITYGSVRSVHHDEMHGFIPIYEVSEDRLCTAIRHKIKARGIGANMAVRRDVVLKLGGFDTELGAGARFASCEDGDIAVRCLLAGYYVYETAASSVDHYGFRTWEQARALMRDSFFGIGAAFVKPIRCGHREAAHILFWELWSHALMPSLRATLTFQKNMGWGKAASFLRGVANGWRTPIDRTHLVYLPELASAQPDSNKPALPPQ